MKYDLNHICHENNAKKFVLKWNLHQISPQNQKTEITNTIFTEAFILYENNAKRFHIFFFFSFGLKYDLDIQFLQQLIIKLSEW